MRRLFGQIAIVLIGLITQLNAFAQALPPTDQFNEESGLPSNFVYTVFQDSKGYLWFLAFG